MVIIKNYTVKKIFNKFPERLEYISGNFQTHNRSGVSRNAVAKPRRDGRRPITRITAELISRPTYQHTTETAAVECTFSSGSCYDC